MLIYLLSWFLLLKQLLGFHVGTFSSLIFGWYKAGVTQSGMLLGLTFIRKSVLYIFNLIESQDKNGRTDWCRSLPAVRILKKEMRFMRIPKSCDLKDVLFLSIFDILKVNFWTYLKRLKITTPIILFLLNAAHF